MHQKCVVPGWVGFAPGSSQGRGGLCKLSLYLIKELFPAVAYRKLPRDFVEAALLGFTPAPEGRCCPEP